MPGFEMRDFDFQKLIEFAEQARDDVFLETPEGDRLNLKSKLTQLLALSSSINWGKVTDARIICKNREDETELFRLNFYRHD